MSARDLTDLIADETEDNDLTDDKIQPNFWKMAKAVMEPTKLNMTLKVVANSFFPYVTILEKPPEDITYSGPAIEILQGLAQSIGFGYNISKVTEQGRFSAKTGNWSGAMGMLAADKVDIAAMPFMINMQRYSYVWFTPHVMAQDITILAAQKKGEIINEVSFTAPMDLDVWLYVFLAIAVAILLFYFIRVVEMKVVKNQRASLYLLAKHAVHFLGVMVGEGITEVACIFESEKVLVGFFWIFAIIVSYWYQGFLSSNMVLGDDDGRINTMSDLAEKQEVRPVLIKGTSVASILENSPDEDFQGVWRNIETLGENESIVSGKQIYGLPMFKEVMNQRVAIIAGRMSSDFKLAQQCSHLKDGNFYFAEESFFPHFIALAGKKKLNNSLKLKIRLKMRLLDETGVIPHMFNLIKYKMPVCLTEEADTNYSALDLIALIQGVWLLIAGYVVGMSILIIEFFLKFSKVNAQRSHQQLQRHRSSQRRRTLDSPAPPTHLSTAQRDYLNEAVPLVLGVRGHESSYGRRRSKTYNFWEIASSTEPFEYDPAQEYEAFIRFRYPKYY